MNLLYVAVYCFVSPVYCKSLDMDALHSHTLLSVVTNCPPQLPVVTPISITVWGPPISCYCRLFPYKTSKALFCAPPHSRVFHGAVLARRNVWSTGALRRVSLAGIVLGPYTAGYHVTPSWEVWKVLVRRGSARRQVHVVFPRWEVQPLVFACVFVRVVFP